MYNQTRFKTKKSGATSSLLYKPKWQSGNAGSISNLTITAFWALKQWMLFKNIWLRIRFLEMPRSPEPWWHICARCSWTVRCLRQWEPTFWGKPVSQEASRTAAAASTDSWTWRMHLWMSWKWCFSHQVKRVWWTSHHAGVSDHCRCLCCSTEWFYSKFEFYCLEFLTFLGRTSCYSPIVRRWNQTTCWIVSWRSWTWPDLSVLLPLNVFLHLVRALFRFSLCCHFILLVLNKPFRKKPRNNYWFEFSLSGQRSVARADRTEVVSTDRSPPAGGSAELLKDSFSTESWQ